MTPAGGAICPQRVGRHPCHIYPPSPYNPELAAINNQYFSLFDNEPVQRR